MKAVLFSEAIPGPEASLGRMAIPAAFWIGTGSVVFLLCVILTFELGCLVC